MIHWRTIYSNFTYWDMLFMLLFFWPHRTSCRSLVPGPGIEPGPSAVEARIPDHRPAREFPRHAILEKIGKLRRREWWWEAGSDMSRNLKEERKLGLKKKKARIWLEQLERWSCHLLSWNILGDTVEGPGFRVKMINSALDIFRCLLVIQVEMWYLNPWDWMWSDQGNGCR